MQTSFTGLILESKADARNEIPLTGIICVAVSFAWLLMLDRTRGIVKSRYVIAGSGDSDSGNCLIVDCLPLHHYGLGRR